MAKYASLTIASSASTSVHTGTYHQCHTPLTQHSPQSSAYIPPPSLPRHFLVQARPSASRATAVARAPRAHAVLLASLRKGRPPRALLPRPLATPDSPIYRSPPRMGHARTAFVSCTSLSRFPITPRLAHTMLHVHPAGRR